MQGREYDYIRGNTAIAPERKYREVQKNKKVKKHNKSKELKRALQRKNDRRYMLGTVALVFSLGFITIFTDSKVFNMQREVKNLEKEISSVKEVNEDLRAKVFNNSSLSNINDNAEKKLGMHVPQSSDVVSIDFSKNYFENVNKNEENTEKTSWFSKISNLLK